MSIAPLSSKFTKREAIRGAWTAEEDQKLAQVIEVHGPRRWRSLAAKAGLHRCGKSCRLRWMNYLRPNIKRGNISDQEEDLILRLHKLLGNRWSLIAGRLPGRTDNEIKNYWNSHLSKKIRQNEKKIIRKSTTSQQSSESEKSEVVMQMNVFAKESEEGSQKRHYDEDLSKSSFDFCSEEEPLSLEWMSQFLELDQTWLDLL
ncbi:hypothetical protein JCGZ_07604 [Jatropha curcas]|uniref:MYB family protein n=1 Tax=Jatropha curcas TaxID=180498 RepID=A0A067KG86_JATCU|nr:MYB family protein [Jatropha curcas]KDP34033.1 hypothetical protein JCGZ_07604 [Jatropha curcas]